MKKVFAILLVLALVAGFVFAADSEQHKIVVKSDVTAVVPVFALKLNDTAITNSTTAETTTDATNSAYHQYTNRFGEESSYVYGTASDADTSTVDVGFNLDQGGSVTVYAVLLNPAKQIETYTLTFSDGVFAAKKNGGDYSVTPTITTTEGTSTTGCVIAKGDAVGESTTNFVTNLTFDGKLVTAASSTPYTLATALYTYAPDNSVDLLETGKYYYANIVLTVAAT